MNLKLIYACLLHPNSVSIDFGWKQGTVFFKSSPSRGQLELRARGTPSTGITSLSVPTQLGGTLNLRMSWMSCGIRTVHGGGMCYCWSRDFPFAYCFFTSCEICQWRQMVMLQLLCCEKGNHRHGWWVLCLCRTLSGLCLPITLVPDPTRTSWRKSSVAMGKNQELWLLTPLMHSFQC
jgi:hypothetical protein